jgi:hypothetical protein
VIGVVGGDAGLGVSSYLRASHGAGLLGDWYRRVGDAERSFLVSGIGRG